MSATALYALELQMDELRSDVDFASSVLLPLHRVGSVRMEMEREMDLLRDVADGNDVARNRYESLSDCREQLLVREEGGYDVDDSCIAENLEHGMEAEATYQSIYGVLEAVHFRIGNALAVMDLALLRHDMPRAQDRTRRYANQFLLAHEYEAGLFEDLAWLHAAVGARLRHIREHVAAISRNA